MYYIYCMNRDNLIVIYWTINAGASIFGLISLLSFLFLSFPFILIYLLSWLNCLVIYLLSILYSSYVDNSLLALFIGALLVCCLTLFSLVSVPISLIFGCVRWLYIALFLYWFSFFFRRNFS